jgi:hypothetical protein
MCQPNMVIFRPPIIIKKWKYYNFCKTCVQHTDISISHYIQYMLLLILLILPLPETVIKCDMLDITLNLPQMVKRQVRDQVILLFRRALPTWIWTMRWQRSNFLHLQRIKISKSIFKHVTLQHDHVTALQTGNDSSFFFPCHHSQSTCSTSLNARKNHMFGTAP